MNRRSYRSKYKNQPVPRKDLQKILEAGLAAPSKKNFEERAWFNGFGGV